MRSTKIFSDPDHKVGLRAAQQLPHNIFDNKKRPPEKSGRPLYLTVGLRIFSASLHNILVTGSHPSSYQTAMLQDKTQGSTIA